MGQNGLNGFGVREDERIITIFGDPTGMFVPGRYGTFQPSKLFVRGVPAGKDDPRIYCQMTEYFEETFGGLTNSFEYHGQMFTLQGRQLMKSSTADTIVREAGGFDAIVFEFAEFVTYVSVVIAGDGVVIPSPRHLNLFFVRSPRGQVSLVVMYKGAGNLWRFDGIPLGADEKKVWHQHTYVFMRPNALGELAIVGSAKQGVEAAA